MAWLKLNRSPIPLGARHLDDVTVPGEYCQRANAETIDRGYPTSGASAGILVVRRWSDWPSETNRVIQEHTTITGRRFLRSNNGNGVWSPWKEL